MERSAIIAFAVKWKKRLRAREERGRVAPKAEREGQERQRKKANLGRQG